MSLQDIRIVLVNTTHSGNIGATARAMKTMGLSQLVLVNPCAHLSHEAVARASGAENILTSAQVFDNLKEAIADCALVFGASGRERTLPWPIRTPEEAASQVLACSGQSALVFGRERDGLSNEELQCCNFQVSIPTQANFKSLNLAQAVQILCYELRKQLQSENMTVEQQELASAGSFQALLEHMEAVLINTGFLQTKQPKMLIQRLRRVFYKAELDASETNMLRGVLTSIEKSIQPQIDGPKTKK